MIDNTEIEITIDFTRNGIRDGIPSRYIINVAELTRIKPRCSSKLLHENTYRDFYVIEGLLRNAENPVYMYKGASNYRIQFTPEEGISIIYSYLRKNCPVIYDRCVKNYDREYKRVINAIGIWRT